MFGFGKGKNDNKKKSAAKKKNAAEKTAREELIAEAMKNAQKAREEIGEENLQRMAAELKKQQSASSPPSDQSGTPDIQTMNTQPDHSGEQPDESTLEGRKAKQKLQDMDKRILASHLRDIIDEDKP